MAITIEWLVNELKNKVYAVTHAKAVVRGTKTVDYDLTLLENRVETLVAADEIDYNDPFDLRGQINKELIDLRNGAPDEDGNQIVYYTAGDAVRTQIGELSDALKDVEETVNTLNEGGLQVNQTLIKEQVDNYLTEHPEVISPIPDGSVGVDKLSTDVAEKLENSITSSEILTKNGSIKADNCIYAETWQWLDDNLYEENRIGQFVEVAHSDYGLRIKKADSYAEVYGVVVKNPGFVSNAPSEKFNFDGELLRKYAYITTCGVAKIKVDNSVTEEGQLVVPKMQVDFKGNLHPMGIGTLSNNDYGYRVLSIAGIEEGSQWAYVLLQKTTNTNNVFVQTTAPLVDSYLWFQPKSGEVVDPTPTDGDIINSDTTPEDNLYTFTVEGDDTEYGITNAVRTYAELDGTNYKFDM